MYRQLAVALLLVVASSSVACVWDTTDGLDAPTAAVVAAAGNASVWATGGCTHAGCDTGWSCNERTRRCERLACGGPCSDGQYCDEEMDRCLEDLSLGNP